MAAAKHLLCSLAGTVDLAITYKQGGFKVTALSYANWGNSPDNGKSMCLYLLFFHGNGGVTLHKLYSFVYSISVLVK